MNKAQIIKTLTTNKKARELALKAAGAFMRGESPTTFMKNLAMTDPLFQGYDYEDIDATAAQVCKENNANIETMKADVEDLAKSYIH